MPVPSPDPPINGLVGVHGSLIRVLKEDLANPAIRGSAPLPKNVTFDERPSQSEMYPTINIKSDDTDPPEYNFEDGKTKVFNVTIEVYGVSLADAELLGEAVERSLERGEGPSEDGTCAAARIASMIGARPDCVVIMDRGGERYEAETNWSPASYRSHVGYLRYSITIRRTF